MNQRKKKVSVRLVTCMCLILTATLASACEAPAYGITGSNRMTIDKDGNTITVLDASRNNELADMQVKEIKRLEGVRGVDWISEERLLVEKENPDTSIYINRTKLYNLYLMDLPSGVTTSVRTNNALYQANAILSPDRKRVYFAEVADPYGMAGGRYLSKDLKDKPPSKEQLELYDRAAANQNYVADLETKEVKKVTGQFEYAGNEGSIATWIGSNHIARVDNNTREIIITDISKGTVKRCPYDGKNKGTQVFSLQGVEDKLYYTLASDINGDTLMERNMSNLEDSRKLTDSVWRFRVSPDGQKIALGKDLGTIMETPVTVRDEHGGTHTQYEDEQGLFLTDRDGKQQGGIIARTLGSIRNLGWSPDGEMLAFMDKGLQILNVKAGKLMPVSEDIDSRGPIAWSPSGKQVLIGGYVEEKAGSKAPAYKAITYIVKF